MEERAEKGARLGSEGVEAGMHDFGRVIIFQHIMEVMQTLYDSALMLIVSELP